jgi:hypothetical protein
MNKTNDTCNGCGHPYDDCTCSYHDQYLDAVIELRKNNPIRPHISEEQKERNRILQIIDDRIINYKAELSDDTLSKIGIANNHCRINELENLKTLINEN